MHPVARRLGKRRCVRIAGSESLVHSDRYGCSGNGWWCLSDCQGIGLLLTVSLHATLRHPSAPFPYGETGGRRTLGEPAPPLRLPVGDARWRRWRNPQKSWRFQYIRSEELTERWRNPQKSWVFRDFCATFFHLFCRSLLKGGADTDE